MEPRPLDPRAGRLVVAILLLALSVLAQSAFAQTADELDARADRAREQASGLQGQLRSQGEDLADQQAQAATAAERAAVLSDRLERGEARLAELAAELDAAKQNLADARERLRRSSAVLGERLVAIYKDGLPDETDLLLAADGYDDLAANAEYLQRIKAADDALIERARSRRAAFDAEVERTAQARDEQAALAEEIRAAAQEAAAVRAEAEKRAAAIAAARAANRSQIGALENRAGELDRRAAKAAAREAAAASAYPPQDGDWAIPTAIVMCESGGDYSALNPVSGAGGAYQILPSTWKLYGGKGLPHEAPPAEQDRIAAMIWADSGPAAWECAG